MGHLHGGIEGGLLDEQGGVDDGNLVLVGSSRHQRKRVLATQQSYFDVDAVDQKFILQKQIHVETTHHVDHATAGYVISSSSRVGRRGHERTVQGDVDLTPQRMQPVVNRSHGFGRVEIVSVDSRHLRLHV